MRAYLGRCFNETFTAVRAFSLTGFALVYSATGKADETPHSGGAGLEAECPLWVVSGHSEVRKMPDSRIWGRGGVRECLLSANSGHWRVIRRSPICAALQAQCSEMDFWLRDRILVVNPLGPSFHSVQIARRCRLLRYGQTDCPRCKQLCIVVRCARKRSMVR